MDHQPGPRHPERAERTGRDSAEGPLLRGGVPNGHVIDDHLERPNPPASPGIGLIEGSASYGSTPPHRRASRASVATAAPAWFRRVGRVTWSFSAPTCSDSDPGRWSDLNPGTAASPTPGRRARSA